MTPSFVREHHSYQLRYAPQATHDGKFLPFLIIRPMSLQVSVEWAGTLDSAGFESEEEAAEVALIAGMDWVDIRLRLKPRIVQPRSRVDFARIVRADRSHAET